jgi:WD40 repeat protein
MGRKLVVVCMLTCIFAIFLLSCTSRNNTINQFENPLDQTHTPVITIPVSGSPTTTVMPATPSYGPFLRQTDIPPVYESITLDTIGSLSLLAQWEAEQSPPKKFLAFSPDSKSLMVSRQIWNVTNGNMIDVSKDILPSYHLSTIRLSPYSINGLYYAEIGKYGSLTFSKGENASRYLSFYLDETKDAFFFPDGKYLLVTFINGRVWFIDITDWESSLLELEDGQSSHDNNLQPDIIIDTGLTPPQEIYVCPDYSKMAFVIEDKKIQIWNTIDLTLITTITSPNLQTVVAFNPDCSIVASSGRDGKIHLWNAQNGQSLIEVKSTYRTHAIAFSPNGQLMASLDGKFVNIWSISPSENSQSSANTSTAIAQLKPTTTRTPASIPLPSPTPTSSLPKYEDILPLNWPIASPSDDQIEEAANCSVEDISTVRYPERLAYSQLESAYEVKTACDWAVLAYAYVTHFPDEDVIPEEGKHAFAQAFIRNPAFAFNSPLFYSYFSSFELVSPPPFVDQPITSVTIDYEWGGIGEPSQVSYQIEIKQAHLSEDEMKISIQAQPPEMITQTVNTIDPAVVQSIRKSFTDFLPVGAPVTIDYCTDNDPDWKVSLTFLDGSTVELNTYHSNLYTYGAPWQTEINGQYYFQFSPKMLMAMNDLFKALKIQPGQPMGMYCHWVDTFGLAYP